jgi:DNA gyrase subunit A
MFTNKGKVYTKRSYEIPVSSRTSKGMNIVNLLELDVANDEKVTTVIPVSAADKAEKNSYFMMVTRKGVVKRTRLSEYLKVNKNGKIAITLDDGDELAYVLKTNGRDEILIASTGGNALKMHESAVRVTGRTARGVRGIRLAEGTYVAGVTVIRDSMADETDIEETGIEIETETGTESESGELYGEEIDTDDENDQNEDSGGDESVTTVDVTKPTMLTITKNGFGKRCEFERFTRRSRGGKGMMCHRIGEKTGELIGALSVLETDDIMIITDDGTIIRTPVSGIPVYVSRAVGGVRVMRTGEGVSIKSFVRVTKEEDGEDEANDETNGGDNNSEEITSDTDERNGNKPQDTVVE